MRGLKRRLEQMEKKLSVGEKIPAVYLIERQADKVLISYWNGKDVLEELTYDDYEQWKKEHKEDIAVIFVDDIKGEV